MHSAQRELLISFSTEFAGARYAARTAREHTLRDRDRQPPLFTKFAAAAENTVRHLHTHTHASSFIQHVAPAVVLRACLFMSSVSSGACRRWVNLGCWCLAAGAEGGNPRYLAAITNRARGAPTTTAHADLSLSRRAGSVSAAWMRGMVAHSWRFHSRMWRKPNTGHVHNDSEDADVT